MKVTIIVERTEGGFTGYLEELPGCISFGNTLEELRTSINDAVKEHIDTMKEDGDEIPKQFKNKYELRLSL